MKLDSAPGPDGFMARFYTSCWDIIKLDLLRMVRHSQSTCRIGGSTNSTFLTLIPKEKGATSFSRFRPISLCNLSYKIITKIIANRLKKFSPESSQRIKGGSLKGERFKIISSLFKRPSTLASRIKKKEW